MTTNPVWIRVDPDDVARTLDQVVPAAGEVVLDFAAVCRIDSAATRALEELADRADKASAKVVLRAVNVDIYKVLKLLRLTARFTYLSSD